MEPSAKSEWSKPEGLGVSKPRARRMKLGPTTTNPLSLTWKSFTWSSRGNTSDVARRTRMCCGPNVKSFGYGTGISVPENPVPVKNWAVSEPKRRGVALGVLPVGVCLT
jgi:hypothetical protein